MQGQRHNSPLGPSGTPDSTYLFFPSFASSCLAFTTCRFFQLLLQPNDFMASLPWHYTHWDGTRTPLEGVKSHEKAHRRGGRSTNIPPVLVLKQRTVGEMHGSLSAEWLNRWLTEWITEHTSNLCSKTELGSCQCLCLFIEHQIENSPY